MEEFFNTFSDAIFEFFTNLFSFDPFKVFVLASSVVVFCVYFFYSLASRGKKQ